MGGKGKKNNAPPPWRTKYGEYRLEREIDRTADARELLLMPSREELERAAKEGARPLESWQLCKVIADAESVTIVIFPEDNRQLTLPMQIPEEEVMEESVDEP